ncbi:MAG: TIGR01777 family oxidoreductase [Legionella sp.]
MNILIAGGTGLIGQACVRALAANHKITVLGRNHQRIVSIFKESVQAVTWSELSKLNACQYHVIINLCGHNISSSRWNQRIKQNIITSRIETNRQLISWISTSGSKPHFYCANAVGIYGLQASNDHRAYDEDSVIDYDAPRDFLNEVGICWERSLQPGIDYGLPITTLRFGVVLDTHDGLLKKLIPSYKFGLGAIIGDGQQILSWIEINDLVKALLFLLDNPKLLGPVNLCSPNPVSQAQFAKALAQRLHRPLLLKIPALIIKLMLGEMGDLLITRGQRVLPKRLQQQGFQFNYPTIEEALQHQV